MANQQEDNGLRTIDTIASIVRYLTIGVVGVRSIGVVLTGILCLYMCVGLLLQDCVEYLCCMYVTGIDPHY